MPDCDYCAEQFDEEEPYLRHLRDEHLDDLGPIERRRVDELSEGEAIDRRLVYGAWGVGILLAAVVGWLLFSGLGGGGGEAGRLSGSDVTVDGIEGEPLPQRGSEARLSAVERFESAGAQHVADSQEVDYERIPPLSGPHHAGTVRAGYYEGTPQLERIVHTLEHGAVVVYYDPEAIDSDARASLREYAKRHTSTWASVVVAENPNDDPAAPYVLTAWRTQLTMTEYDARTVQAFLAEFLGRGPENPVR